MAEADGQVALALGFLEKAPERAARILEMHAPDCDIQLLERLDAETAAAVLRQMAPRHAAACLEHLEEDLSTRILRGIPAAETAPMLRALAPQRRAALLRRLPSRQAVTLNWLLSYPDSSVGAWTDARAFTLSAELAVPEALAQIREAEHAPPDTLYVLGRQGRLTGVITTTALVRADRNETVGRLCGKPPTPLQALVSLASAASLHSWQLHNALPVVDHNQQFVGVLGRDALERGLMQGGGTMEQTGALADTLLEAAQAYWSGLSALWQTAFGLLSAPLAQRRGTHKQAP